MSSNIVPTNYSKARCSPELKNVFPDFFVSRIFLDIVNSEWIEFFGLYGIDWFQLRMRRRSTAPRVGLLAFLARSPSRKQQRGIGMGSVLEYRGRIDRNDALSK